MAQEILSIGEHFGGTPCILSFDGQALKFVETLPPYSMRFKFSDPNYNPLVAYPIGPSVIYDPYYWKAGCSWTQISADPNIWEYRREPDHLQEQDPWKANAWDDEFRYKFRDYEHNQVEVIGGNTTGITSMDAMLAQNPGLTRVALFDTSSVYDMQQMFLGFRDAQDPDPYSFISHLVEVPDFDFSSCLQTQGMFNGCVELETIPAFDLKGVCDANGMFEDCRSLREIPAMRVDKVGHPMIWEGTVISGTVLYMDYMFWGCRNVASGITAMYTALSTNGYNTAAQAAGVTPARHAQVFEDCGVDTQSGSAELAGVPSSWKE